LRRSSSCSASWMWKIARLLRETSSKPGSGKAWCATWARWTTCVYDCTGRLCCVAELLPEGVPRSLLEAASMAKPIITTDAVGCRDVVTDGVNGYLCRPRDAKDLARQMRQMMVTLARRAQG